MRVRTVEDHIRAARERTRPTRTPSLPSERHIHVGSDADRHPIRLSDQTRLEHCHAIGATGSGKSTLLKLMAASDFARGRGGVFFDPHGGHPDSPFAFLVDWATRTGLIDRGRVHVIDLAQPHLIGFNPLAPLPSTDPSVLADVLLDAFERVWNEDSHGKPTTRTMLKATFAALAELGLPLADAKLLYDPRDRSGLRGLVIDRLRNEYSRNELERLHDLALDDRNRRDFRAEIIGPWNRINDFISPVRMSTMFGQTEPTLDLRSVMDAGEIVLVNLQDGETASPADTRLFGTILLRYLLFLSKRRRHYAPFFVTVDECGRYLSGDVPTLLAEVRKYGIGLTLAHQAMFQLGEPGDPIREALSTLTETKFYFRMKSHEEALALAPNVFSLNLEMPVAALSKPTAVGQRLVELESMSVGTARSETRSATMSEGEIDTHGESTSETWSESESETDSVSDTMTDGASASQSLAESAGASTTLGASNGLNQTFDPASPFVVTGLSTSSGNNLSTAYSGSSSRAAASGSMSAKSSAVAHGTSRASGHALSHAASRAKSRSQSRASGVARTDGITETRGKSQTFATVYETLPTAVHSKENVLTMAAQALLDLPVGSAYIANREVRGLVRVPFAAPKSLTKEELARLVADAVAGSRFAIPIADAVEHIATRRRALTQEAAERCAPTSHKPEKVEPESWREPFDYPDPPPPPDAPRGKPNLRVVHREKTDVD